MNSGNQGQDKIVSIIIPAHNEETVIQRSLEQLLPGINSGEFEVIVVCNGCHDHTAELVRSLHESIHAIEVERPSKANALNVGDSVASSFPRIYLDADVLLSADSVRAIIRDLKQGDKMVVSPVPHTDLSLSSWAVRAYYDAWMSLPYVKFGMIGAGVYAVSETGRKRFNEFPDIIADDGYIRLLFSSQERGVVTDAISTIIAPKDIRSLVKINTRIRIGGYELHERYAELLRNDDKDYGSAVGGMLKSWRMWHKTALYIVINLWVRSRARNHITRHGHAGWARDDSSRE